MWYFCARACFVCALRWEIRRNYAGFCMWGGFHAKGSSEAVRQPTAIESEGDLGICLCKLMLCMTRKKKLVEMLTWRKGIFRIFSDPDHLTAVHRALQKWPGRELIYPISSRFSDFHFVSVKSSVFIRSLLLSLIHKFTCQSLHFPVAASAGCWAHLTPLESHWHLWEHDLT